MIRAREVLARLCLIACVSGAAACKRTPPPEPTENEPSGTGQDPAAEATQIFATRCTPCHGPTGAGDGPASATLNPHPRNFHDGAWQASVTDGHIDQIIQFGGAAVGKSPAMPANPDLVGRDAVVAALRARVRSFRQ